mgnify:CR=1 FL=1|tara:strand:+ start:1092 stop:1505 length:414 start_codon:yes stop_codon:yes gene_type:complete
MSNVVYVGPAECHPDVSERQASESILPRKVMVAGSSDTFDLAAADQGGVVYFALENILGELSEAYATGETIQGARPKSGEYYELSLASSQTISKDDALTTDASGDLVALGTGSNTVAYADEAVTTTGTAGSIRVYIK